MSLHTITELHLTFASTRFHRIAHALPDVCTLDRASILLPLHPLLSFSSLRFIPPPILFHSTYLSFSFLCRCLFLFFFFSLRTSCRCVHLFFALSFFILSLSLFLSFSRVKERGRRVATIAVGRSAFSLSIRPGHPVVFGLFPAYPFTFDLSWLSRTALRGSTPRIIAAIVGK